VCQLWHNLVRIRILETALVPLLGLVCPVSCLPSLCLHDHDDVDDFDHVAQTRSTDNTHIEPAMPWSMYKLQNVSSHHFRHLPCSCYGNVTCCLLRPPCPRVGESEKYPGNPNASVTDFSMTPLALYH
jgi:hypothetical protein